MKILKYFISIFAKAESSDLGKLKLTLRKKPILVVMALATVLLLIFRTPKMGPSVHQREVRYISKISGSISSTITDDASSQTKVDGTHQTNEVSGSPISISKQIVVNENVSKKDLLTTGTFIPTLLLNKIVSNSLELPALAVTSQDIRSPVTRNVVIPRGSKLIGRALFDPKGKRLQIHFRRVIFPNQKSFAISGLAMDRNEGAQAGLSGKYYSEKWKQIAAAVLASFVGGAAQALKEDSYSPFGIPIPDRSLKGVALEGLATSAFDQARSYTEALNQAQGYVEVSQGYPFLLFLMEDF